MIGVQSDEIIALDAQNLEKRAIRILNVLFLKMNDLLPSHSSMH
jgi:hypothetical protein